MRLTPRLLTHLALLFAIVVGGCGEKRSDSPRPEGSAAPSPTKKPVAKQPIIAPKGRLSSGQVLEGVLGPDETHTYAVHLTKEQWIRVFVRPKPATSTQEKPENPEGDFALRLRDGAGNEFSSIDEMWAGEEEQLVYPHEGDVNYRLEVSGDTVPYQLWIELPSSPDREIELWAEAQQLERSRGQAPNDEAEAARSFLDAAEIWQTLGKDSRAARAFEKAAKHHQNRGHWEQEAEALGQAAALRVVLDHAPLASVDSNRRGLALRKLGRLDAAEEEFRRALQLSRDPSDPYPGGEIAALNNLGLTAYSQGIFDEAQRKYEMALGLSRELAENSMVAKQRAQVLNNLARIQLIQERTEISESLLMEALDLRSRVGLDLTPARLLQAWVYTVSERPEEAIEIFESLVDRFQEPTSRSLAVHHQMAQAYEKAGRPQDARRSAARAAQIMHAEQLHRQGVGLLIDLCRWRLDDRSEDHVEICRQSLNVTREFGGSNPLAVALWQKARSDRLDDRPMDAWNSLSEAVRHLRELEAGIVGTSTKAQFVAHRKEILLEAIDVALEIHRDRPEDGFARHGLEIGERLRAPELAERLSRLTDPWRTAEPALRQEHERTTKELQDLKSFRENGSLAADDSSVENPSIDNRIRELFAKIDIIEGRAFTEDRGPSRAVARNFDDLVNSLQASMDDETAVLSLLTGPRRSYLWILTRDGLKSRILPGKNLLEAVVNQYMTALRARDPVQEIRSTRLAAVLFGQDGSHLEPIRHIRRLIFVGDGLLQQIPLSALPIQPDAPESEPLIKHFEIVHAPSLTVIESLREKPREPLSDALAIFGDPFYLARNFPENHQAISGEELRRHFPVTLPTEPLVRLPFADIETREVAQYFSPERTLVATGPQAGRDRLLSEDLSTYAILHFTSHGVVDIEHPELSGLLLAEVDPAGRVIKGREQTKLTLYDISRLQLSSELVVAGACETAVGDEHKLSVTDLAQGFLQAGSRRVVASLWKVETRSTADLMDRFYHFMIEKKLPPGEALRQAKLHLQEKGYEPYLWAPFVFYGDWNPIEQETVLLSETSGGAQS